MSVIINLRSNLVRDVVIKGQETLTLIAVSYGLKKMCVPLKNSKPGTLKGRFKTTGYCSNDGSAAFE